MIEAIEGLLAAIILIPGFLCVYIPYKVIAIKIRFTNFELSLISLIMSIIIFLLTLISYQFLNLIIPSVVSEPLWFSQITSISSLIENQIFSVLFTGYTIIFISISLYFISKDRLRRFRKWITGNDIIISPEDYVWDIALDEHDGHVIIETNTDDYFFGFIKHYTSDIKEKEILLKQPERYDIDKEEFIPIEYVDSILFLNDDIRRIYLINSNEKDIVINKNNSNADLN